jgi:hypothetical protein
VCLCLAIRVLSITPAQPSSPCVASLVSGINVQNPNRDPAVPGRSLMRDLLARALNERPSEPEPERAGGQGSSAFSGGGYTLGSDEVESTYVPDPNGSSNNPGETPPNFLLSSRTQSACVCVRIPYRAQLRRLRFDISLFGATDLAWRTASCAATTILPKHRSCPRSMPGNKKSLKNTLDVPR